MDKCKALYPLAKIHVLFMSNGNQTKGLACTTVVIPGVLQTRSSLSLLAVCCSSHRCCPSVQLPLPL